MLGIHCVGDVRLGVPVGSIFDGRLLNDDWPAIVLALMLATGFVSYTVFQDGLMSLRWYSNARTRAGLAGVGSRSASTNRVWSANVSRITSELAFSRLLPECVSFRSFGIVVVSLIHTTTGGHRLSASFWRERLEGESAYDGWPIIPTIRFLPCHRCRWFRTANHSFWLMCLRRVGHRR